MFSGDGTYNEAINGAAGRFRSGSCRAAGRACSRARSGFHAIPVAAAARAGRALDEGRTRSIGLGRVNGRRFCFSAGIGSTPKRCAGSTRAAATATAGGQETRSSRPRSSGSCFETRLRIASQLSVDGYGRAALVFVANGRPYTYAGAMPVMISADADFGGGLDFVAPREVSPRIAPGLAFRGIRGTLAADPRVIAGHDLDGFVVRCDRPLPLQADGEDLGDVTEAIFAAERGALDVLV